MYSQLSLWGYSVATDRDLYTIEIEKVLNADMYLAYNCIVFIYK